MAQYEKFEEWMIGQCVLHLHDPNDPGIVVGKSDETWAQVEYEKDGIQEARVSNLIFQDVPILQEITINGQRYKLVKIID